MMLRLKWTLNRGGKSAEAYVGGLYLTAFSSPITLMAHWTVNSMKDTGDEGDMPAGSPLEAVQEAAEAAAARMLAEDEGVRALLVDGGGELAALHLEAIKAAATALGMGPHAWTSPAVARKIDEIRLQFDRHDLEIIEAIRANQVMHLVRCSTAERERDAAIARAEAAESRVAELEAAQRWIPVTERLPPFRQTVLAYQEGVVFPAYVSERSGWFDDGADDPVRANPTHWRPLPAGPT